VAISWFLQVDDVFSHGDEQGRSAPHLTVTRARYSHFRLPEAFFGKLQVRELPAALLEIIIG
jgi:hypothetical protein